MKCILENITPNEHVSGRSKDTRYAETMLYCPLFDGRQICLWCCLHICGTAEPLRRGDYQIEHPEYADMDVETGRTWDEIWSTCSRCSRGV